MQMYVIYAGPSVLFLSLKMSIVDVLAAAAFGVFVQ